jgi:hypothetical protein
MNTFFKFIAWLGLVLFTLGAMIAFHGSWVYLLAEPGEIGVIFEYMFAIWFGIPGIVMMTIGGIISKPKYFWLASIIAGLFYIISFFAIYTQFPGCKIEYILITLSFSILPGLIAVIMWIKLNKDRLSIQQQDASPQH